MRHNFKSLSVFFTAVTLALIVGISMLCIGVSAANETNSITSALLTKDLSTLEVKVSLTSDTLAQDYDGIYLFEIMPYQSASQIGQLTPLASEKPSKDITFKVNFDVKNRPRLFAKLVVAVKTDGVYTIIAPARYIDNVDAAAVSTFEYPSAVSKKGLQVQMIADAQELGISHTVVNIPVNEYLHAEKQNDSIAYVFYNQTYYFDRNMVEYLDHRVKVLTEANVNVYLNILLTAPDAELPLKLRSLYYDGVSEMAEFFAFNMQNQDSVMYLEAFLTFIAERYTREDAQYGFAGSFIMGYEVNSNRNSNSMGSQNMDSYLNSYIAAFRVADTALRSVYSNGRVYLSLANNFSREAGSDQISTDPLVDYAAKSFLDAFNEKVKYAGNIPWRVAVNPYPSDPSNTAFWNDDNALDSSDTPYITMKNIDVLCDYLKQDTFLYNGSSRSVLVSEFGVSADPDSGGVSTQAAAIAYAYYKAVSLSDVEAIIYHRHVDHDIEAQAGLWYGLWTHVSGTEVSPLAKKTSYNVFKYMDTADNASTTASALTLLGVDSWDKVIPGFKETMAQKRTLIETVTVLGEDVEKGCRERLLCEFSKGDLYNFYPSDNMNVVELRADTAVSGESKLYAAALCDNPREYMGISSIYTNPLSIKGSRYVTLKLKADAPTGVENVSVMLRLYSDSGVTYEAIGQIKEGMWTDLTFDISKLSEATQTIDGMKLWIKPYEGSNSYIGSYALWLDNVTILEKGGITLGGFLLVMLVILLLGGVAVFLYLFIRNRAANEKQRALQTQRTQARNDAFARQQSQQHPQRPMAAPNQAQNNANRIGTLSSEEEFRAAYGDSPRQNPMNQNGQPMNGRPMQGQPMQGQQFNGQPMQGGQYAQQGQMRPQRPMNPNMQGQGMQRPMNPNMQGQPMNGRPINGQPMQSQPMQGQQYNGQGMQGRPANPQSMHRYPNSQPQGQMMRPMQNGMQRPMNPNMQGQGMQRPMNPNMQGQPMNGRPINGQPMQGQQFNGQPMQGGQYAQQGQQQMNPNMQQGQPTNPNPQTQAPSAPQTQTQMSDTQNISQQSAQASDTRQVPRQNKPADED